MYSIDTNLVVGLINDKDRLHKTANNLVDFKTSKDLHLLNAVLNEVKEKYFLYYNQALAKIQLICNTTFDEKKKEEKIKNLSKNTSKLQNFYRQIASQLNGEYSKTRFTVMRTSVIKIVNNLIPAIEEKTGKLDIYSISQEQNDKQQNFIKRVGKLKFSDQTDKEIFVEFIYTSLESDLKEFYSNDKTFINQSKRTAKQEKLENVSFYKIKPTKSSPYYKIA